jgi:tetratricopeptide (TPR) repeat protein
MDSDAQEIMKKGLSFLEDGKYEEALGCFEKILASNPNDPDVWNKKGVALRSLGRYNEAIESFSKALEIAPRDLDAS